MRTRVDVLKPRSRFTAPDRFYYSHGFRDGINGKPVCGICHKRRGYLNGYNAGVNYKMERLAHNER